MKTPAMNIICLWLIALVLLTPSATHAYVGPGAGISAIGSLLALIAAVVVAIFGFLWYPIKRLMGKKKAASSTDQEAPANPTSPSVQAPPNGGHRHCRIAFASNPSAAGSGYATRSTTAFRTTSRVGRVS